MKDNINKHIITIIIITIACLGLIVESLTQHWEFWMPPILFAGIIAMWMMHIIQYGNDSLRENFYLIFAMIGAFFHGIHETSFFDVAVIILLLMVTFSVYDKVVYSTLFLAEYTVIMIIQFVLAFQTGSVMFDGLNISRVILHIIVVICIYFECSKSIKNRIETTQWQKFHDEEMQAVGKDMEDFLVNISHELRTPVNVVNGMSALILKNEETDDVMAIRDAGIRLSHQIEDIQDYTEIKRDAVQLEEEKYMITSLINDVISSFRVQNKRDDLEFVVDLDPAVPSVMKGDVKKLHKIIRNLIDNAIKFTKRGGVYVNISANPRDYGVNLVVQVTDTGIGMSRKDVASVAKGFYQANKKRNRSTGGIGLGLNVVYGFVHKMDGFVVIESERGHGTSVRLSIPQGIIDESPCLSIDTALAKNILLYLKPENYRVVEVRDFYRSMAVNLAAGLQLNLYSVVNTSEIDSFIEKMEITHIFMGSEEYEENPAFFDELCKKGVVVAISAATGFSVTRGSGVIIMPKPLYGYPVTKILNEGLEVDDLDLNEDKVKPELSGIRALVVDDEPMNLVVATGLFKDYGMITDSAYSGRESIEKFLVNDYDVVFMDHMMPEMDGVEAMKQIKNVAAETGRSVKIIVLTANAISGARKMFMEEGFDGFISKPIDIIEFERVMKKVLPQSVNSVNGGEK